MGKLDGRKVAVLATDGFEEVELTSPKAALERAGARVEILSVHEGTVKAWKHGAWGSEARVDRLVTPEAADDYDALLLPGGVMNPDQLRTDEGAVAFVKRFFDAGKPIAAICHGPWTMIETREVENRRLTSYPSIKTDLLNAGADWVDEEVVIDENLITSRSPDDLPAFNEAIVEGFRAQEPPEDRPFPPFASPSMLWGETEAPMPASFSEPSPRRRRRTKPLPVPPNAPHRPASGRAQARSKGGRKGRQHR